MRLFTTLTPTAAARTRSRRHLLAEHALGASRKAAELNRGAVICRRHHQCHYCGTGELAGSGRYRYLLPAFWVITCPRLLQRSHFPGRLQEAPRAYRCGDISPPS